MVTYVLDSSAVLRYLHNEAGSDRVAEILNGHITGDCEAITAAAHWGEIAGVTRKLYGRREMERVLSKLASFGLGVVPADANRAVRAALIKVEAGVPYVDAFGLELLDKKLNRLLVTADFDFQAAKRGAEIEFLPPK
jgi:PIN domain nuclease of toxin-antitoxin system